MSEACCGPIDTGGGSGPSRRVLWTAMLINAGMFLLEIWQGTLADSVSLLADSIDFLGDAANYGISLYVLSKPLHVRATASLIKAGCMGGFAAWVMGSALYHAWQADVPAHLTMGWVALVALVANIFCAALLFKSRNGDSNARSVWLCSRNDAISNLVVLVAAFGVYLTGTLWPDLIAAGLMATLAASSAVRVWRQAWQERRL